MTKTCKQSVNTELQKAFQIRSIRCMMRTFATKKAIKAFQIMSISRMITVLLNKKPNMNLSMEVSFNAIGSPIYKRISDPRQTLQFEIQPVTLLHISWKPVIIIISFQIYHHLFCCQLINWFSSGLNCSALFTLCRWNCDYIKKPNINLSMEVSLNWIGSKAEHAVWNSTG